MRKFILLSLAALALTAVAADKTKIIPPDTTSTAPAKLKLTLDEAKTIALNDNPSLAVTKARIEAALAAVAQAKAAFWPKLDFAASVTRLRDMATRPDKDYDNKTLYNIEADASWLIFDGFQRKYALLTAEYTHLSAEEADNNARRLMLQAVSSAFYSALLAQDNMDIAKEDAVYNKMLLDDAKKRQEGGIAKPSEVLNFILQVQNADVDYITAENTWRTYIVALGALLAINEDAIWENITLISPDSNEYQLLPFQELLDYAIQHRPDLRSINSKIQIARDGIKAAQNTWYPTINLFTTYGFERAHSAHFNKNFDRNITYGVSLSWNLFNGGKTNAQIQQARAELKSAICERDNIVISINSEIRQNILAMESSRKQLKLQEAVLATAKQIRDLVHQEYIGGTTTITRLNEAQTDVTKASSAKSAAYVLLLNSIEALRASTAQNMELK